MPQKRTSVTLPMVDTPSQAEPRRHAVTFSSMQLPRWRAWDCCAAAFTFLAFLMLSYLFSIIIYLIYIYIYIYSKKYRNHESSYSKSIVSYSGCSWQSHATRACNVSSKSQGVGSTGSGSPSVRIPRSLVNPLHRWFHIVDIC